MKKVLIFSLLFILIWQVYILKLETKSQNYLVSILLSKEYESGRQKILWQEELIKKLEGKHWGDCKSFAEFFSPVLDLPVGKINVGDVNHYFLILSETENYWEVLCANWNWDGKILRHRIGKWRTEK